MQNIIQKVFVLSSVPKVGESVAENIENIYRTGICFHYSFAGGGFS